MQYAQLRSSRRCVTDEHISGAIMNSKRIHKALWVVQGLLGVAFVAIGGMKLSMPVEEMAKNGATWAVEAPWKMRALGALEFAGGVGVVLPAALRIMPVLTPIAAACLSVLMVGAIGFHVAVEGNPSHALPAFVFMVLCDLIVVGRFKLVPIAAKS